jgi:long-chain fatty acid transport protein
MFMRLSRHPTGVFLILLGLLFSHSGFATNGYFPHGVGTKNKSMAGAGMAMPEDAISIVNNPAVAVFLENRTDVGLSVFQPRRNYTTFFDGSEGENNTFAIGPADIDNDKDLFFTPEIARTHQLSNDSAFAWAFYMQSGMATSFKGGFATFDPDGDGPSGIQSLPGTFGDGTTGMELSQAFVDITWAKMAGKKTSVGISAVLAAQSLEVKGTGGLARYTETFATSGGSVSVDSLGANGREMNYGVGLKIGLHRLLGEHFRVGIMYQSQINMGSAKDYSDLFANGGDIDIPAWFRMGVTWQPIDVLSFSIDAQYILYSGVDALSNSFSNVYDCPTAGLGGMDSDSCLGGNNGPGFGWNDVPVYNIGASWSISDKWTLRGGFSFSDQPTPVSENVFNILMLNMTEAHYTAGVSRKLRNGHELSFSLMYSEEESLEYPNQLDPTQVILLTTDQFDFQVSYSWKR